MLITIVLATLMGAFALAFGVRIVKWLITTVYDLAPYVVLVAGFIALIIVLEQYEQPEKTQDTQQH